MAKRPTIQALEVDEELQASRKAEIVSEELQAFLKSFISDGQTETQVNHFVIYQAEDGSYAVKA